MKHFWAGVTGSGVLLLSYFFIPNFLKFQYDAETLPDGAFSSSQAAELRVSHLPTPKSVRALYLTSYAAGDLGIREQVVRLLDETEANAVVIDVKDYSGRMAFEPTDGFLRSFGSAERRIPDLREFINKLHTSGVYVIGRISVFQDPFMTSRKAEWAVLRQSDGEVWKDHKGISWIDPGAVPYWDYIVALARESYKNGFDELNFDYIRFPSDGNMIEKTVRCYRII